MQNVFSIYLSGGMKGLTVGGHDLNTSSTLWRGLFADTIGWVESDKYNKVYCFNPCSYYGYDKKEYDSEIEVIDFNFRNLRQSDVVVAYFNNPDSIGTAQEIALAKFAYDIPVFGIIPECAIEGEDRMENVRCFVESLDFSVRNCVTKWFGDIESCIDYITHFYLT